MGTFLSLSKSTTSISLDISEIALLVFGVLLVVGLVGEYAESEKWKRYVKTFEMFVILGVAGELFADGGIFLFSSHLQTIADQEIAEVTKRAGDAKDSAIKAADAATVAKAAADAAGIEAGKAETSAGVAIGKSDRANAAAGKALGTSKAATHAATEAQKNIEGVAEQADDLDRAIWQTQFLVSARSLRNRELLISTLRKFNKKKVVLESFIGDAEGWGLCNSLFNAANNAEMDPVNNCGKEYFSPPLLTGILIFGSTKQEIAEFSNIMADAIDPGGAAGMRPEPGSTLTIRVGIKVPYSMDKTRFFNPPKKRQATKPNTKP